MKKSTLRRLLAMCLCLTLVTVSLVGGTLAKYTTTTSGESTARVAKWAFTVGDNDTLAESFTFSLFEGITEDSGVATEKDVNIIAPGTSGSFEIGLTNTSEVAANYAITFEESEGNTIPVQYSLNGATWNDAAEDINIAASNDTALNFANDGDDDTTTVTVYWRWVFDSAVDTTAHSGQTDATDTTLGSATDLAEVTVTATVTVTQLQEMPTT